MDIGLLIFILSDLGILVILIGLLIVVIRAVQFKKPLPVTKPGKTIRLQPLDIAARLAEIIQCKTTPITDTRETESSFYELQMILEQNYPNVHQTLIRERVNQHSLLFTWHGKNRMLKPILFAAHQDVVPVEESTEKDWKYPPFSGTIAENRVWGRGTLDMKHQLAAVFEAVEYLLQENFQPERTIYIALGHDEETGGHQGARHIADYLKRQGVQLECVIDEGKCLLNDFLTDVKAPIAFIGVAEKGSLSLELTVSGKPGHSAMPPAETPLGILGRAIARIEENPPPADLTSIVPLFNSLGPVLSFTYRMIFGNLWLFGGLVKHFLAKQPETNAMIRSTCVPTIMEGGIKANIIPGNARAVVNIRIRPGDSIDSILRYIHQVVNDNRVFIRKLENSGREPTFFSPSDGEAFERLSRSIKEIFGNVPVAPALVVGGTDSRYYQSICKQIYRFSPILLNQQELKTIHGTNESIFLNNLSYMVHFFVQFIKNWNTQKTTEKK